MNERIKELRKKLNMTQDAFSKNLDLSRNFIAQVESGTKSPSDRTIKDICRIYNINEEWLRTGQGEMYIPPDDETAALVENLLEEGKDNPFYATVLSALRIYDQQDQQGKEVLKAYFRSFIDDLKRDE